MQPRPPHAWMSQRVARENDAQAAAAQAEANRVKLENEARLASARSETIA